MTSMAYPHIEKAKGGVPVISGTNTKVVEVVLDRLAHHWDADEIQRQHPHLSLSQIYAALAYYHDRQDDLDHDIAARLRKIEDIATSQPGSVIQAQLRTAGELP